MDRSTIIEYVNLHFSKYFELEDKPFCLKNLSIKFPDSGAEFFKTKQPKPATIQWKHWEEENLPLLFDTDTSKEWFELKDSQLVFNYDLPSLIFYFLSGWQEEHCKITDKFGRFPYAESIQKEHDFVMSPVVNYYFFILQKGIETFTQHPLTLKQQFNINMTHDIDLINSGWKSAIKKAVLKGHLFQAFTILIKKIKGIDPFQNLEEIMQLEKEQGLKSTFYILPKNDNQKGIQNADYDINQPYIQKIIAKINADADFKLGLHTPALETLNPETLNKCIQAVGSNVTTNRFHYLAVQQRDLKHFKHTSITTDSSLGFAEHSGFRHGSAWPFHPFDFEATKAMSLIEIPLVAMDVSLTNEKYMNLTEQEAMLLLQKLTTEVKKVHGTLTLLWHNDKLEFLKKIMANQLAFI